MTDTGQPRGVAGPPWSVDLLADLQAGALDDAQAAELWPRVQADPEAMSVIAALEATQADLAALADAPVEPMPAHVAARIDAALAAAATSAAGPAATSAAAPAAPQAQPLAPVVDLAAARRKRNQRLGWGLGVLSAAAAAVAVVALVNPSSTTGGTPLAGGEHNGDSGAAPSDSAPSARPPLNVSPERPQAAFGAVNGMQDYGPLGGREGLDECLQAHDIPTTGNTAGVRPGKVGDEDAVVAVLTTGEFATYRIVAVSPSCSADNPGEVFIDKTVGRGGN